MKRFPFYKQYDQMDCGPTCLKMISQHYGISFPIDYLRQKSYITRQGVSFLGLSDAADSIGLQSLVVNVSYNSLSDDVPLPCIAHWKQRHFVVVHRIDKKHVYIADPAFGRIKYTKEQFLNGWLYNQEKSSESEGYLLLLEPTPDFYKNDTITKVKRSGLSYLIPFFTQYKNLLLQIIIGLLLSVIISLMFPFITKVIIDEGINLSNMHVVNLFLFAQFVLIISLVIIEVLRSWILTQVGMRVSLSVLSNFLVKLLKKPIVFFNSKMDTDIMQRIDDQDKIDEFLKTTTINALFSFLLFSVFGILLAFYNFYLFLVFLVGSAVYSWWVIYIVRKKIILEYIIRDEEAENRSSTLQLIRGIEEIKLNNSEKKRRWEWEAIRIRVNNISIKLLRLDNIQNIVSNVLRQLINVIITYLAVRLTMQNKLSFGELFSIQYILGQLIAPLHDFVKIVQVSQNAKISINRLLEILDTETIETVGTEEKITAKDGLPANKSILITNLSFKYGSPKSENIIKNLNFSIPEGKVTAIVGASGSGKTTLLKLLLNILEPTEGTIKVGNTNLKDIHADYWYSQCGAVMQDGFIFADTLLRNITESSTDAIPDKDLLKKAVYISNLEEKIESLPLGYKTNLSWGGISLSGGENQRVLIARAAYKNPSYLFFDEATSALDATNERVIMDRLNSFFDKKTVVIVAHRLSTVMNADQIIVLDKGEIAEQGTHQHLIHTKGLYFNLIKNQLELGQ